MNPILTPRPSAGQRGIRPSPADALAAAFERHADMLVGYIRTDLAAGDWQLARDAEDVAADAWLLIVESAGPVEGRVLDADWLRLIARAAVRRYLDRRGPERPVGLRGVRLEHGTAEDGFEDLVLDSLPADPVPADQLRVAPVRALSRRGVPAAREAVAA
ncbi:hypothetical protein [Streptomyces sp. MP131-18]|uniref:hypothetical protein n=1 Tax=Streptomyces sp. MP131-18 TaxID=1857892 RepID=UPI00097CB7A4|nr:hypothetical protein [Streptomyces sp. MP131-18]ONK09262.1 hypothetical protein STBA_71170 [Streptomyces sp. MP131-18]